MYIFNPQDEYDSYMTHLLDTQKPSQHKVLYHHIDSLSENPSTSDKLKGEEKRVESLEREARHLLDENARYYYNTSLKLSLQSNLY